MLPTFWIGTVSVIDLVSGKLLKQIKTGRSTEGIALSPDRHALYVTVVESNEIIKISTQNFKTQAHVKLKDRTSPIRVQVSGDGAFIVVNHSGKDSVGIYDAFSLKLIEEINVGKQPIGLALSRVSDRAYVANMKDGTISIIDLLMKVRMTDIQLRTRLPDGLDVIR